MAQVGQKYKLMLASTLNLDSSAMAGHYDVVRYFTNKPTLLSSPLPSYGLSEHASLLLEDPWHWPGR